MYWPCRLKAILVAEEGGVQIHLLADRTLHFGGLSAAGCPALLLFVIHNVDPYNN